MSDIDLDLSGFDVETDTESGSGQSLFTQSFDIIKKAMKNVIQEIVITLEDDSAHIIYLHKFEVDSETGAVSIDWSTPSSDRKTELEPHLEKCLEMQISAFKDNPNHMKPTKKRAKKLLSF